MSLTPAQRSLRSRIAGHALHAQQDSNAIAARARKGFMAKFEREVDPNGELPDDERKRRAQHAMKAHMTRMSLAAAQKRRAR